MKKALVIGSEGNIGKPLVKHLLAKGYDVLESDIKPGWRKNYIMADVRNPSDILPAFDWKPDYVFMLGAMVSRVTCEQASSLAIATNLAGTQNVLDLTKRANAMLIYFSTSEVYGPDVEIMDESVPPRPNNRYGLSKLLSESLVQYEVEQYGLKAVTLRPFMVYDENEDLGDHRSAMIRFAADLTLGKSIEVHRNSERSWCHITDAVRAFESATRVSEYAVINVGSPDVRPMSDLAQLICRELGASQSLIRTVDLPERMTLSKRPMLVRQQQLLKTVPQITLEDGVRRVCARTRSRLNGAGATASMASSK